MVSTVYEIPLISQPQKLTVSLAGTNYQLYVYWCVPLNSWIVDISDSQGELIAGGLPMVTGVDLLGQLKYLSIPGALVVQSTGGAPLADATFDNLGQTAILYFIPFA